MCNLSCVFCGLKCIRSWEVLALASVTWRWCVETCIPVRPCFFLAAWLACCHTQPAVDWELVFRGRTRCTGQKWWLRKRLPCIFFCCEHNVKWKWLSERTAPEDLNTCKDINGQTHSYCGKFHLRRVWFLAHFYTYRHTMRGYSFFMGCQQKSWAYNNRAGVRWWLKHPF